MKKLICVILAMLMLLSLAACGKDKDGMPIGMQLIGKSFGEATILNAAYQYQQAAPEKFTDTKWGVKL